MDSANCYTEINISPMFSEKLSKGLGDMERTRKCYERTDRQTDGRTDKCHSYNPLYSALWWAD